MQESPKVNFEDESRASEFKRKTQERLAGLLNSRLDLRKIAELLNATEFLEDIPARGGRTGLRFKVEKFIDSEVKKGTFLKVPDSYEIVPDVILPPGEGELITNGASKMEKKEIIPRNSFLVQLLTELNFSYAVVEGTNSANMMRGLSYQAFIIPEISKLVLVNNEEGNATFVVHSFNRGQEPLHPYLSMTKNDLKALSEDLVAVVNYSGDENVWKLKIKELLLAPNPDIPAGPKELPDSYEHAPEGWLTNRTLAGIVSMDKGLLRKMVDAYRASHKEWFKKYKNKKHIVKEHYHPDLVSIIKREVSSREKAPEGWKTLYGAAQALNVSRTFLQAHIKSFRSSNPEWFKNFYNEDGRQLEHFHPDLIEEVRSMLEKRPGAAPEGWLTRFGLKEKMDLEYPALERFIAPFRLEHPGWFKTYTTPDGNQYEYFHPDLIKEVESEFAEKLPEGWRSVGTISTSLRVSRSYVLPRLADIAKQHPEFARQVTKGLWKGYTFFAPDVISILEQELANLKETAPEGWMTASQLAKELNISNHDVTRFAKSRVSKNGDLARVFKSPFKNVPVIHYHPDLIVQIREHFKPAGTPRP